MLWIKRHLILSIVITSIFCVGCGELYTAEDWKNEGNMLIKQEKYAEAIQAYDKSLELNLQNANTYVDKSTILEKLGREDEAQVCYNKVEELENTNTSKPPKERGVLYTITETLVELVAFILYFIAYTAYLVLLVALDLFNQGLIYIYKVLTRKVGFIDGISKGIKCIILGILWILVGLFINTIILSLLDLPHTHFYDILG